MNPIVLTVHGTPRPQPRPQSCGFMGRNKHGKLVPRARSFNKENDGLEAWKARLRIAARGPAPATAWNQAVRVDVEAFFDRPYWLANVLPARALEMLEKPDRDNLDKVVLDTLSRLGYWVDDSHVYIGKIGKWYCSNDCAPGAIITITFLEIDPVYHAARQKHLAKLADDKAKREAKKRGETPARSVVMNDQMSIEQFATHVKSGGRGGRGRISEEEARRAGLLG